MRDELCRLAVVFGGRSFEHNVACISAKSVLENLDRDRFKVFPIGIDKQGKWHSGEAALSLLREKPTGEFFDIALPLNKHEIDIAFPVLHGPYGEDGTIQGFFTMQDIPYIGAGVASSAICMDKDIAKRLFTSAHIPQTDYLVYHRSIISPFLEDKKVRKRFLLEKQQDHLHYWTKIYSDIEDRFQYPVFIKPANAGSSVGISCANSREELKHFILNAFYYDEKIIVEETIRGRELFIAVLGNHYDNLKLSAIAEIVPLNNFYDYEAKYNHNKHKLQLPARLSSEEEGELQYIALKAYQCLCVKGTARMDFFLDKKTGKILLSEVNTLPGLTKTSLYPRLWIEANLPYAQLLTELIELGLEEHAQKEAAVKKWNKAIQ